MSREISIIFALKAALSSGFTAAFQNASTAARNVASSIREMERSPTGRLGASMISQREKIRGLSGSLRDAKATLSSLREQAQAAGGANAMLARQIAQAERRVNNLSGALNRQLSQWRETTAEAATAAGSVHRLTEEYNRLAARMERARRVAQNLHANQARAEALRNQRANLQNSLLSTVATTASVALPVKLAISAEDTFADLRKVMDAPEDVMQQVFMDAQEMSNKTGKSFEDIITIMTAAAQAGLGKTREELLGVADQAVKMSIAWGVSAEEAGKSMATWQAAMGLTAEQARKTGDVINALSNEMNAEAGEINAIFTRLGPLMKESGVATQDIAALATAFKAAGAEVEVSGTAMKNFVKAMAAGKDGLTDVRVGIYKAIGIDPDQLQKELYTDAKSAILHVLEALKNAVPPEKLNSIASMLFGEESIAAITPLIGQIEQLKNAFSIANGDVDGSVDDEYANRMKTTATAISQMSQSFRNLGIEVGKTLLPVIGDVAKGITGVVGAVSGFVRRFPGVASVAMTAGAALAALAVTTLGLGLVYNTMATGVNMVRGLFLRLIAAHVTATGSTGGLSLVTWIFTAASRAAGAAARFFAGGLRSILMASGVGALLVALGYGVSLLIDNWDNVASVMSKAWGWVTDTWSRLGVFFSELGNNLGGIFAGWGDAITGGLQWAWNGALTLFSDLWSAIAGGAVDLGRNIVAFFTWAAEGASSIWQRVTGFFSGIWQNMAGAAAPVWQSIAGFATWACGIVTSVWSGITGFFSGIVDSIFSFFSKLFQWLADRFSWVTKVIKGITGFVGKVTGAVTDAWYKAFGDGSKPSATPVADTAVKKPVTVAASPVAVDMPVMAAIPQTDIAPAPAATSGGASPVQNAKPKQSDFDFKKPSKNSGGSKKSSGTGKKDSGPVTIVSLGGDNSRPQTIFIPAMPKGQNAAQIAAGGLAQSPAGIAAKTPETVRMPAVQTARAGSASTPLALPKTPALVAPKMERKQEKTPTINIDLKQNFDLLAQDAGAVRRVLESLKPDMEALVRRALEKISSDRRRTAYVQ